MIYQMVNGKIERCMGVWNNTETDIVITRTGVNGNDDGECDRESVELCKHWLRWNAKSQITINKRHSSYSLKHAVEKENNTYITNGEFIQAALELGYKMSYDGGLNADFNMKFGVVYLMGY